MQKASTVVESSAKDHGGWGRDASHNGIPGKLASVPKGSPFFGVEVDTRLAIPRTEVDKNGRENCHLRGEEGFSKYLAQTQEKKCSVSL